MVKGKKGKAAEKKARTAAKQEKKAAKGEKKAKTKATKADGSDVEEDVDLDAVLAEYARKQEQFLKVTETTCEPPSPRGSSTIIGSPSNNDELLIFGGEYYNGALALFYNDLLIYHTRRDEWRLVTSPNSPLPRSGHAWTRGGNTGNIYLFGGEFSSPKQGTFYHYNDFWRLDERTREWTKLEGTKGGKGGPPARSGHRMTYFKNYIILFGGFQDTSAQTKYLSDLWLYDTATFQWISPVLPPASQKPEPRSSFTFLPHESGAALYGGYSRVKASSEKSGNSSKKSGKGGDGGGGGGTRNVMRPCVHQDAWFLRITPPASDSAQGSPPTVRWERRKRPANAPNPPRAGATMASHKGRGIQFGGVHDIETSEEGIDSEFFNALTIWNVDRNRCFGLALRRPRAAQSRKTAGQGERGGGGRGAKSRADEAELLRKLRELEVRHAPKSQPDADGTEFSGSTLIGGDGEDYEILDDYEDKEDEDPSNTIEKRVQWEMPHPRFNAQLAVQGDVLYIFGGTYEKGDREYTFDEMWALDLGKLDGVKEIYRRELADWVEDASSDEDEDDDEEDEEDDDEGEGSDEEAQDGGVSVLSTDHKGEPSTQEVRDGTDIDAGTADSQSLDNASTLNESDETDVDDPRPSPRPFESLRDFFARTSSVWQDMLIAEIQKGESISGSTGRSVKELRKQAFTRAEAKWWDSREEIQALEDAQEEAGIGEVVNLADKTAAAGTATGAGRRR